MKILHLSDLHLGKRVNEISMIEDQKYILLQILKIIEEEAVDVILLCGDVFDKSIPTIEAIHLLDEFLNKLNVLQKKVLIISGNHDSGERLSFGRHLLSQSHIYISSVFQGETEKITIKDEKVSVCFYLLPFVKPVYINHLLGIQKENTEDCLRYFVKQMNVDTRQTNILLAHQFVTANHKNPELSDSETSSLGGLDQVDYRVFDDFDYVALGHIHKPQAMGREHVRYGGSILKYSFSEIHTEKKATILTIEKNKNIDLSYRILRPLHDMREIRCSMKELLNGEAELGNLQDYMHVILTDEDEMFDVIGKVRKVYPNVMQISFENRKYMQTLEHIKFQQEHLFHQNPIQLFSEFYKMQNHVEADQKRMEMMTSIFKEADQ